MCPTAPDIRTRHCGDTASLTAVACDTSNNGSGILAASCARDVSIVWLSTAAASASAEAKRVCDSQQIAIYVYSIRLLVVAVTVHTYMRQVFSLRAH